MNPKKTNEAEQFSAHALGERAYQAGFESSAAIHFAAAAEQAASADHRNNWAHFQRWEGNSLLWAGRPQEALRVLLPVATCRDPRVQPELVYAAMTDVVMLNLFHGTSAGVEQLLAECHCFLTAVNMEALDHRLDLLRSIHCHQRGDFDEALRLAIRANNKQRACPLNGSAYREFSHARRIAWSAFFLKDTAALETVMAACDGYVRNTPLDHQDWHWMRILRGRLAWERATPQSMLREHADAATRETLQQESVHEIAFDIGRGLMLGGDLNAIPKLRWSKTINWPYQKALFEVDLELNKLLLLAGRKPVDLDVERIKPDGDTNFQPAHPLLFAPLKKAADALHAAAGQEAVRLGTEYPLVRARHRLDWIKAVLPAAEASASPSTQNPPP